VLPGAGAWEAELVTVAHDSIAARDTVVTGARSRELDGCRGSETANWSADGARLYLHARYSCPGGLEQTSSGMLALSEGEELIDIQQTTRGNAKAVRVSRYLRVAVSPSLPREVATALEGTDLPLSLARGAASAPLTVAAIADASRSLEPEVVEALLVERGGYAPVDAKQLAALADAGVPGRTTDVIIALAYPSRFAIRSMVSDSARLRAAAQDRVPRVALFPFYPGYSSLYGLYGYRPFGYSPYDYIAGGRRGYGGGYPYGYYQQPVIVVRSEPARPHGRVVNGRGYTRGSSGSDEGTGSARPASTSGSSSSGSSSSGSSGSSNSGSSGETRTAKPRP
jgi:hypothetical protein